MFCEVLKPITGPDGIVLTPGLRVDVSGWRWAKQLVTQRKLRPVLASAESLPEVEAAVAFPKRGRPRRVTEDSK